MRNLCLLLAVLLLACWANGQAYTELPNIDDITTQGGSPYDLFPVVIGWSKCVEPTCNPGGGTSGPTSFTQTFADTVQSKDGLSMAVAMVAPAETNGTNGLFTFKVGGNPTADTLQYFKTDLWFFCDTNCGTYVLQYEFDDAIFCASSASRPDPNCDDGAVYSGGACVSNCQFQNGVNYMFGFQCDLTRSGGVIEVWNQHTGSWITATYSGGNIPCTQSDFVQPNAWHHLQKTIHRIAGDYTSCGGNFPTLYYDNITLDGVSYTPTNSGLCAGQLHAGWSSVWLTQVQFNIGAAGSASNTATIYYDLLNFYYASSLSGTRCVSCDMSQLYIESLPFLEGFTANLRYLQATTF